MSDDFKIKYRKAIEDIRKEHEIILQKRKVREQQKGCVYCYKHKNTNIVLYIGRTINGISRRHYEHVLTGKREKSFDVPFDKVAEKLGWENIQYEILEDNLLYSDLCKKELHYIHTLNPFCNLRGKPKNCQAHWEVIYSNLIEKISPPKIE